MALKRASLRDLRRLLVLAIKYEEQFEPTAEADIRFTRSAQLRHALKSVKAAQKIPRGGL